MVMILSFSDAVSDIKIVVFKIHLHLQALSKLNVSETSRWPVLEISG